MHHPVLEFVHAGDIVSLRHVPPTRTLLQVLREDLGLTATKEGCNEGDCGACTVVLGEQRGRQIKYSAVNACIRLAHSVHGMAVWTAQDLAGADGTPHPVQQALLQQHASQCGFCTPGFAMSLFGLYQNQVCQGQPVSRALAQQTLSGNLCRCTGYRPILAAAQQMAELPLVRQDETRLLSQLELLAHAGQGLEADLSYKSPKTLAALLAERAAQPQAQLVAGCTDVALWINKLHMDFGTVLDLTQVAELRVISQDANTLTLGAAVSLTDAFAALLAERPQLHSFLQRFAGLPVRNSGTLGGNIANGSPIGDSMPLLIALHARVLLASVRGSRELALDALYTGYRQNLMAGDEVLTHIKVPRPTVNEFLRVYKVSKRQEDDISAVCLAVRIELHDGQLDCVSIGVGGVAATPVRARQTEAALTGQVWSQALIEKAKTTLRGEFAPISDMRASSGYRTLLLGNLLQRFWLESLGQSPVSLDDLSLEDLPA
ncbi:MAG: xanthine dehydrogenase small subunit [Rhodoferax sp.]|nr:xanthine dehydrogenase small subunit [Rhodoferax sp.]